MEEGINGPSCARKLFKSLKYAKFNQETDMVNPKFKLGMQFDSHTTLKRSIIESVVKEGRDVCFCRNDKVRVKVKCVFHCEFLISAYKGKSCANL